MTQDTKPQESNENPQATELNREVLDAVAGGTGKKPPPLGGVSPSHVWDTGDGVVYIGPEVTLESPPRKKPHRP